MKNSLFGILTAVVSSGSAMAASQVTVYEGTQVARGQEHSCSLTIESDFEAGTETYTFAPAPSCDECTVDTTKFRFVSLDQNGESKTFIADPAAQILTAHGRLKKDKQSITMSFRGKAFDQDVGTAHVSQKGQISLDGSRPTQFKLQSVLAYIFPFGKAVCKNLRLK